MNDEDKRLLDDFQRDFPLVQRPFAEIGARLGLGEDDVIDAYRRLADECKISRIGAVIQPNCVGASTLAAMAVPEDRIENVARYVSGFDAVNHNYERDHRFNLWFVVAAMDGAEVEAVLDEIRAHTGLDVMNLPMVEDYHLDLGFKLWN